MAPRKPKAIIDPDNTTKSGPPPVRDEKGRWVKGTPSPNPAGAPPDKVSWAGVIDEMAAMAAEEIAAEVGKTNELGRSYLQLPKGVNMKRLIVARVMAAIMFEPSSGLVNTLMERTDGKVPQAVALQNPDGTNLLPQPETMKPSEIAAEVVKQLAAIEKAVKHGDS